MKKTILVVLSLLLVFPMFGIKSVSALENVPDIEEDFTMNVESIDIANEFIRSNTEIKKVEIIDLVTLSSKLTEEELQLVVNSVATVNNLLESGTVVMLDDGRMFLANEIMYRGGKINRSEVFYWGIRRYNNYANTKSAADQLISTGKQFKTIDAIPSGLLALLGLTGGIVGTISGVLGIGSIVGNWCYDVGKELRAKNNTYGTVLDINWMAQYKVWKQKSTTK